MRRIQMLPIIGRRSASAHDMDANAAIAIAVPAP
jgi:hypothetical protein